MAGELKFLAGDGEMMERIRAFDWTSTRLGSPAAWPQVLRTVLHTALTTRHPMFIFWDPDLVCLYNDAYRRTLGADRHPSILGLSARQAWGDIWSVTDSARDYAIVVMDGRGYITTWNAGAQRLMGCSENEAVGQPLSIFFTAQDVSVGAPDAEMAHAVEHGRAEYERWHPPSVPCTARRAGQLTCSLQAVASRMGSGCCTVTETSMLSSSTWACAW